MFAVVIFGLLLYGSTEISGKRIAVLTYQVGGHLTQGATIGELLVSRGHEVYMLVEKSYIKRPYFQNKNFKFLSYSMGNNRTRDLSNSEALHMTFQELVANENLIADCKIVIENPEIHEIFKTQKFDLAIVHAAALCYYLLPKLYGIPYISMAPYIFPWLKTGIPSVLTTFTCLIGPNRKLLYDRYKHYEIINMMDTLSNSFKQEFLDYLPGVHLNSLTDLIDESMLTLISEVPFLDCPTIKLPSFIQIGGFSFVAPEPVPDEFKHIVDAAIDGVILVSFGSCIDPDFSAEIAGRFFAAFARLQKYQVIWRLDPKYIDVSNIPKNVHFTSWLPQKQILGHKNTKIFITHCGQFGMEEAFFSGVPMIGFPIIADQFYNSMRMTERGFGKEMDIHSFTSDELYENLVEMLTNRGYSDRIKDASSKALNMPDGHPRDRTIAWIEHVMQYGGDHLRTSASFMSFTELYMLDVICIFIVSIIVLIVIFVCIIACTVRRFLKKKRD
ncbi:UDP-glucuronosyltransferase 3A1-like [Tubulanus polymorphus]|uniref:UDP-glucuronosyltransferase 3A1-like n=1 Tax=Tubulanus polymorphus TaxID=672921 RepID=UPI003DA35623